MPNNNGGEQFGVYLIFFFNEGKHNTIWENE